MNIQQPDACNFCQLVRGNAATEIVCSGDSWVAFFPLNPATPGHTLVIPRKHVSDLWQIEPALGHDLMDAAIHVGRIIRGTLKAEGMNLITSAGETAEQTVFHLHLHLVPRWRHDGFGQIWPSDHRYENAALGNVAERIRQACEESR